MCCSACYVISLCLRFITPYTFAHACTHLPLRHDTNQWFNSCKQLGKLPDKLQALSKSCYYDPNDTNVVNEPCHLCCLYFFYYSEIPWDIFGHPCAIEGFLNWINPTCSSDVYFDLLLNDKNIMPLKTFLVQSYWLQLMFSMKGQTACLCNNLPEQLLLATILWVISQLLFNSFTMWWLCNQKIMMVDSKKSKLVHANMKRG